MTDDGTWTAIYRYDRNELDFEEDPQAVERAHGFVRGGAELPEAREAALIVDFTVFVVEDGGHTGMFRHPKGPPRGVRALDDIGGETEPRKIVRALGLPEDYLFP